MKEHPEYADAQLSSGWWDRFKERNGLHLKHLFGESGSVNKSQADVNMTAFRADLELMNITLETVINMDETGSIRARRIQER